jgi:hypothetical protein
MFLLGKEKLGESNNYSYAFCGFKLKHNYKQIKISAKDQIVIEKL